jgi:hypothetical protein
MRTKRSKKMVMLSRQERKMKEYRMAVIRTVFNVIGGVATAIGLALSLLIYHKMYFGG